MNIYLKIIDGVVSNHTNYPEGVVPNGLVKAPEEYALGWTYEDGIFSAPIITYAELRAEAYPSTVDQLDDIYHNGVEGWKATIKAVKDTYPKETI